MILLKDALGIRIGKFEEEVDAVVTMADILNGYKRTICTIEQDGKTTHVGNIVGEIVKVGE